MKIVSSDPVLAVHDLDRTSAWFTRVLGCNGRSRPRQLDVLQSGNCDVHAGSLP